MAVKRRQSAQFHNAFWYAGVGRYCFLGFVGVTLGPFYFWTKPLLDLKSRSQPTFPFRNLFVIRLVCEAPVLGPARGFAPPATVKQSGRCF